MGKTKTRKRTKTTSRRKRPAAKAKRQSGSGQLSTVERRKLRQLQQHGEGMLSVLAAAPQTAWKITKQLEQRAKEQAIKVHKKREEEVRTGKRKHYAGESFTCALM